MPQHTLENIRSLTGAVKAKWMELEAAILAKRRMSQGTDPHASKSIEETKHASTK